MKTALIMNDNSYPGREYLKALVEHNIEIDVIKIGCYPVIDEMEEIRCGHRWTPPLVEEIFDMKRVFSFSSLKDKSLLEFLRNEKYVLGIQGGTGILKNDVIQLFRDGILNFHPGKLPEYRGCSAPEWQLWEGKPVICTCHLVDELIDHGPIFKEKVLSINHNDYHKMRSMIYPEIGKFVVEILKNIQPHLREHCIDQDESRAVYRFYIGDENIMVLTKQMVKGFCRVRTFDECPRGGGIHRCKFNYVYSVISHIHPIVNSHFGYKKCG